MDPYALNPYRTLKVSLKGTLFEYMDPKGNPNPLLRDLFGGAPLGLKDIREAAWVQGLAFRGFGFRGFRV